MSTRAEPKRAEDWAGPAEIHSAIGALSSREQEVERWRRSAGLFAGPIAFLAVVRIPGNIRCQVDLRTAGVRSGCRARRD